MKVKDFVQSSLISAVSFLKEAVFCDEYASKQGFLQAFDMRIKTAIILLLLLAVMFSRNISFLLCVYALCLALTAASSIRLGFFLKRTWIFIPLFSLFIALPALFEVFSPGEAAVSFKLFAVQLNITRQGIASASFFFVRVLTSVSLCILLVLTTRHHVLLKALRFFRVPQVFVMTLGMCYRYIYLFIEIIQDTYLAIKSRVGYISCAKKGRKVVAWNIAGLWQRSYILHNQVYNAMISRGFTGEPQILDDSRPALKDWFWLGAALLIFGLSLWQNFYLN